MGDITCGSVHLKEYEARNELMLEGKPCLLHSAQVSAQVDWPIYSPIRQSWSTDGVQIGLPIGGVTVLQ